VVFLNFESGALIQPYEALLVTVYAPALPLTLDRHRRTDTADTTNTF
jgi:hypothetical protein